MGYGSGDVQGQMYTAAFAAVSMSTNPTDVFGILASSNSKVRVHEIRLGMQSSGPVNQVLGVQILRGSTASSTSAAITPTYIDGSTLATVAVSSVTQPSSGLVSTASAALIYADSWHLHDDPWTYCPKRVGDLETSQRLHVRVTAPSTTTVIYGTMTFEETGKNPV